MPRHAAPLSVLAALVGSAALPALAQESGSYRLPDIVLDAEAPATEAASTTVAAEDLARDPGAAGLVRALETVPGVTVQLGDGGDAELAVNVRGLQDHGRVAVTVDGVRQNFARSGHTANGTFAIDPEMLRSVEVTRGAGAKPGAIGGAVAMRQVTAADLLPLDGGDRGGEVRLRYGTLDASPTVHVAVAQRLGDNADLTFAVTRAERGAYTAPDGTRVEAAQESRSMLVALGLDTDAGHRWTLSADALAQDYVTGHDTSTPRDIDLRKGTLRLSFEGYDVVGGWDLDASVYHTAMNVSRRDLDATLTPTGGSDSYDTATTGLLAEARRLAETGAVSHEIALTFEAFRDRVDTHARTGTLTPSGSRTFLSFDAEDRMDFGPVTATLGVSFNHYALSAPGRGNSGSAISPRLALEVPLGTGLTLSASAGMAFRPPSLNESLVSGSHPQPAPFEVRPNPDLDPERARTLELALSYGAEGLLAPSDRLDLRAGVFRTQVTDYIGMARVGTIFNNYSQYRNIDEVRIDGFELEARYEADRVFASLIGQVLDGQDAATGAPLTGVPPWRVVLSGGITSADGRSNYGARLTRSGEKADAAGRVTTESYQTLDLFYSHDFDDRATISASFNNILDEVYTPHLNTQPQPGFNATASLVYRF
ncbi:TonB-dependent receptor domain-containing protein [Mesobacterium pallidum]|uniref:TonB-dependent receptor domain-containing protein n=1 Tax=Mesobacterium pallidum TaxID=2872037 RepID=UPI001EE22B7A|nr:TonB-dependent receptor [Mesobacterium pallidum]